MGMEGRRDKKFYSLSVLDPFFLMIWNINYTTINKLFNAT